VGQIPGKRKTMQVPGKKKGREHKSAHGETWITVDRGGKKKKKVCQKKKKSGTGEAATRKAHVKNSKKTRIGQGSTQT